MKTTFRRTARGLWLQGAAAASLALGLFAAIPAAHAQAGVLSNPSGCTSFTGFSWSGGVLSLTCSAPVPVVVPCTSTAASTFSFLSETAADVPAGNATVGTYHRNGCAGQFTINFGTNAGQVAGTAVIPANASLSWADGETGDKTLTFSTSANTPLGKVGAWVTGYTSSTSSTPGGLGGSFVFNVVAAPASGGTGSTPPPGCSTTATYNQALQNSVQIYYGTTEPDSKPPLKPGQSVAASFTYQPSGTGSWGEIQVAQVTNPSTGTAPPDVEVNIDACPGNFTATADNFCNVRMAYPGTATHALYGTQFAGGTCHLTPGNVYYLNVRQVPADYSKGSQASCGNANGCAFRIQTQGLN